MAGHVDKTARDTIAIVRPIAANPSPSISFHQPQPASIGKNHRRREWVVGPAVFVEEVSRPSGYRLKADFELFDSNAGLPVTSEVLVAGPSADPAAAVKAEKMDALTVHGPCPEKEARMGQRKRRHIIVHQKSHPSSTASSSNFGNTTASNGRPLSPPPTPRFERLSTPDLLPVKDGLFCECCENSARLSFCAGCGRAMEMLLG